MSVSARTRRTLAAVALASTCSLAAFASSASAHVSIVTYGTTFTAGANNAFYFRVPHGCDGNPTNKFVVDIPASVTGVKPFQQPGWTITRTLVGTTTTQVVWTANTPADRLPDWQVRDFGVRATLNGKAGDKISFTAAQYCDFTEAGSANTGLTVENWVGADSPTLTLVSADDKVANAADLALLRNQLISLLFRAAQPAQVSLTKSGALNYVVDFSSVWRNSRIDVRSGGTTLGTVALNPLGDASGAISRTAASALKAGSVVTFTWNGLTVASATVS
ncbi:MAG: DUF1775 domain-containing protein [Actinobacteria bacterium]|nr:DUF1775 domain-containing protein [Actinomycetota bacterium]